MDSVDSLHKASIKWWRATSSKYLQNNNNNIKKQCLQSNHIQTFWDIYIEAYILTKCQQFFTHQTPRYNIVCNYSVSEI